MTSLEPRLPPHAVDTIHQFLRHHALGGGADGVVVGLSGGVDSALVARLARDALGPTHVLGVLLPDAGYPPELRAETEAYARSLGVECVTISIEPLTRAFHAALPDATDRITRGNAAARLRMVVWYTFARERRRLVAGGGNKSELLLGYFTKYGDAGVDLLPIGDLYKTEVWALAKELDLPASFRDRAPTAGLWEGQTDEGELGIRYADADRILRGLEELRTPPEIASITGIPLERVRDVVRRVELSRHKRRPPPIPKIGLRTVGLDWRE